MFWLEVVLLALGLFAIVKIVEFIVRKSLGIKKVKGAPWFENAFHKWLHITFSSLLFVLLFYITYAQPSIQTVGTLLAVLFLARLGMEVFIQKKYLSDSLEYIVTLTQGLTVVVMIVTLFNFEVMNYFIS
ncbi:DUF4181 domain-containing protein [Lentibacillus sediminis]|uniref:DUF4181 domain-containing protein n=1 Tax=Lentibacillus sediminis TaxID=1940529 RepID=UPI000C1C0BC1|nr:DUF4181 domain-containing protein [Lentibacillus sediminis]